MNRLMIGLLAVYAVVFAVLEVLYLPLYIGRVAAPFGALGAAIPGLAWLVAVLIMASGGPGGDVLVPGDWKALLLFGLGLLPAGVVLGRHMGGSAAQRAVSGS
jgi:hypothetical protein